MAKTSSRNRGSRWWYLLLLIPLIGSFAVPFYNTLEPAFIGIPFFYWWQMMWVVLAGIITGIVYLLTE